MNESLHVVCPACASVNRVPPARLTEGPSCGRCHAALFDGHPLTLTEANFQTHVGRSDLPVLVDFWAAWCGPCQAMAPVFAQAAVQLEPSLRLAKVDTDANPALSSALGIRSIPTLILFHRGREAARSSGATTLRALNDWVQRELARIGHAGRSAAA